MSEAQPKLPTLQENIQALQYLFDVARQAPVAAAVHDQAKNYAVSLSGALTRGDENAKRIAQLEASASEAEAAAKPDDVAAAVAAAV